MRDYVYHGRLEGPRIGFSLAVTPTLSGEAVVRHDCDPVSAHILCQALNAGVLCMHRLHPGEKLNLRWHYRGALRDVVVDLRADGGIRGLIAPTNLSELAEEAGDVFGEGGQLQVVVSRGGRVMNSGTVACDLMDIPRDLGHYFSLSAQVETELNVMVGFTHDPARPVEICQGLMLEALPGCDLLLFERIRERLRGPAARALLAKAAEADGHFEDLLNALFQPEGMQPTIHVEQGPEPRWFCTCDEEKFRQSLLMLPEEDRRDILAKGEALVVRCEFCRRRHSITPDEAANIWGSDL